MPGSFVIHFGSTSWKQTLARLPVQLIISFFCEKNIVRLHPVLKESKLKDTSAAPLGLMSDDFLQEADGRSRRLNVLGFFEAESDIPLPAISSE